MLSDGSDLLQRDSRVPGAASSTMIYGSTSPVPRGSSPAAPAPQQASEEERTTKRIRVCLVLSLLCAIICGVLLIAMPSIVTAVVKESIEIKSPASPIFNFWLDPSSHGVATFRKFYLFNVTNPLETALLGEAPNVVVRGPFAYREVWRKDRRSVRWYMNGTIGYKYEYRMFFAPEQSIDAVTGEQLSEDEVITLPNGPLRGTMYRVGRLPSVVVEASSVFNGTVRGFPNITQHLVCMLLHLLVNGTVLGPKGIYVQRPAREVIWGYVDPIWDELHTLLGLFDYNASKVFQSQWNGSAVVPSPYTYRSGQMCPLWQTPAACNRSGNMVTLEVSGRSGADEVVTPMLPEDQAASDADADIQRQLPDFMQRPGALLDGETSAGEIVRYAGQLQGQWWWGPERDGMTGGAQPIPSVPLAPVRNIPPFRGWDREDGDVDAAGKKSKPSPPQLAALTSNKEKAVSAKTAKPVVSSAEATLLQSFLQSVIPSSAISNDRLNDNNNNNNNDNLYVGAEEGAQETTAASSASPPVPEAACHRQYGTDGTRFPLPVTKSSSLNVFNDLTGRTLPFSYIADSAAGDGLATLRFSMDAAKGMSNSSINRFCFHQRFHGLLNLSQFVFGDGVVSKGWYLDSCVLDDSCVDPLWKPSGRATDAMMPHAMDHEDGFTGPALRLNITLSIAGDASRQRYSFQDYMAKSLSDPLGSSGTAFRERYDTYVDVLPVTGNTLKGSAVGLVSLAMGPSAVRGCNHMANWSGLDNYTKLVNMTPGQFLRTTNFTYRMPQTLLPFLQMERSAVIGGQILATLKSKLALITAAYATLGTCCGLGAVGAIVCGVLLRRRGKSTGTDGYDAAHDFEEATARD